MNVGNHRSFPFLDRRVIARILASAGLINLAFSVSPQTEDNQGIPWWLLMLLALILIVLILWWLMRPRESRMEDTPAPALMTTDSAPDKADDLEIIEGIGPKISGVLKDAGIRTFRELAATEPEQLENILRGANLRLANPQSWKQQASLAAEGRWDELNEYQARLKGGREVA